MKPACEGVRKGLASCISSGLGITLIIIVISVITTIIAVDVAVATAITITITASSISITTTTIINRAIVAVSGSTSKVITRWPASLPPGHPLASRAIQMAMDTAATLQELKELKLILDLNSEGVIRSIKGVIRRVEEGDEAAIETVNRCMGHMRNMIEIQRAFRYSLDSPAAPASPQPPDTPAGGSAA